MGGLIDLSGQTFGYLTAKSHIRKNNRTYWICECECGNIVEVRADHLTTNKITSCGCHKYDKQRNSYKDETGNIYGYLTVLEKVDAPSDKPKGVYWKCKCRCGKITYVTGHNLRSGNIQSCGCKYDGEDLTNQRFGLLTVIDKNYELSSKGKGQIWNCKCDCGNITTASTSILKSGHKSSCGCLQSKYEALIEEYLINNGILYIK